MQKNLRSGLIALVGVASLSTSWGAITACTGQTLATLTSVADNGNTPANGCGQIDLGFNSFANRTTTGTNTFATFAQIGLTTAGGTTGSTTTQAPITSTFAFTGGNSLSGGGTIIGSFTDLAAVTNQAPPSNSPPYQWVIDGLGLTFTATSSANPNHAETVTVIEAFCLNSLSFSCLTTSQSYGYLSITENIATTGAVTYTDTICTPGVGGCAQTHPTSSSLSLTGIGNSILIATQLSVNINRPTGSGNTLTLSSIQETWDQTEITPEPGTFVLLGSALAGIAVLRTRKRSRL